MVVTIKDGKLLLQLPITPTASKSGKQKLLYSSKGTQTLDNVKYEGKPLKVNINIGINADKAEGGEETEAA